MIFILCMVMCVWCFLGIVCMMGMKMGRLLSGLSISSSKIRVERKLWFMG